MPGTMAVWGEPFTVAPPDQALQPHAGPLRAGRHHLQHLLGLDHEPRPAGLPGDGRGDDLSGKRSMNSPRARPRRASTRPTCSKRSCARSKPSRRSSAPSRCSGRSRRRPRRSRTSEPGHIQMIIACGVGKDAAGSDRCHRQHQGNRQSRRQSHRKCSQCRCRFREKYWLR